jgi:hypothetical protein
MRGGGAWRIHQRYHLEAQGIGQREHVLSSGDAGKEIVHTESRFVGHPTAEASRAKSTALAGECDHAAMPALSAADTQKAVRRNAATKVGFEFVEHEGGQLAAACVHVGQEGRPVFLDRSIEPRRFGTMARVRLVASRRVPGIAGCWLREIHQRKFSVTSRAMLPGLPEDPALSP